MIWIYIYTRIYLLNSNVLYLGIAMIYIYIYGLHDAIQTGSNWTGFSGLWTAKSSDCSLNRSYRTVMRFLGVLANLAIL